MSLDETSIKIRLDSADINNLNATQKTLEKIHKLDKEIDFKGLADSIVNIDWDKITDARFTPLKESVEKMADDIKSLLSTTKTMESIIGNTEAFNDVKQGVYGYIEDAVDRLTMSIESKIKHLEKKTSELLAEGNTRISTMRKHVEKLVRQVRDSIEKPYDYTPSINRLDDDINNIPEKLHEKYIEDINKLENAMESALGNEELEIIKTEIASLRVLIDSMNTKIPSMKNLKTKLDAIIVDIKELGSGIDSYGKDFDSIVKLLNTLPSQFPTCADEISAIEKKLESIEKLIPSDNIELLNKIKDNVGRTKDLPDFNKILLEPIIGILSGLPDKISGLFGTLKTSLDALADDIRSLDSLKSLRESIPLEVASTIMGQMGIIRGKIIAPLDDLVRGVAEIGAQSNRTADRSIKACSEMISRLADAVDGIGEIFAESTIKNIESGTRMGRLEKSLEMPGVQRPPELPPLVRETAETIAKKGQRGWQQWEGTTTPEEVRETSRSAKWILDEAVGKIKTDIYELKDDIKTAIKVGIDGIKKEKELDKSAKQADGILDSDDENGDIG